MAESRNHEHLPLIQRILTVCESAGIRVWLLGGWGVDALCGHVRRPHHDIDLILCLADREPYRRVAGQLADTTGEDSPQKLRFAKRGIRCDSRFFHTLSDGRLVSDLSAEDHLVYPWPPDSFPAEPNGILDGLPVRAISWSAQFVAKAGFSAYRRGVPLRPKDEADLCIIREHLDPPAVRELEAYFPGIPK